jgi:hypothetical protein
MSHAFTQEAIERSYSQRNIRIILETAIQTQLSGLLINWALRAYLKIPEYLAKDYTPAKNKRLEILQTQIDDQGLERLLVKIVAAVLHSHQPQTIQQCCGYLQGALPHEDLFDRIQTAAELLAVCASDKGLYSITHKGSGYATWITVNHWPVIDNVLFEPFEWINNTLFNPPLLEPPKRVTDNSNCGYHTFNEPLILGQHTQHTGKQDYDSINILNRTPWLLDWAVLAEPETTPAKLNTPRKQQDFMIHVQQSQSVYHMLGHQPFYLAWQADSRGRLYSHGYHVNFQSHEYKKAMLSFNHFEVLT